jgi:hypothetical protein
MANIKCSNCAADNLSNARYCKSCGYELPKPITKPVETLVLQSFPPSKARRNNLIGLVVGIVAFSLVAFGVQQLYFKTPSFDKEMMQAASEINKTCPVMVDEQTRLDNTVALPDNSFQYNYTLVSLTKAEINLDTVRKYLEPVIVNTIKTNPDLKIYRDHKTTMIYNYKDKNGEFVHKFAVTADMYN